MYSLEWFDTFSSTIPPDVVERDVDALSELLPRPDYGRILDVGCGIGRVAGPMASRGYSVTGISSTWVMPSCLAWDASRGAISRYESGRLPSSGTRIHEPRCTS